MLYKIPTQLEDLKTWSEIVINYDVSTLNKILHELRQFKSFVVYEIFNANKNFITGSLNNSMLESLKGDDLQQAVGEQRAELRNWTFFEEMEILVVEEINRKSKKKE